MKVQQRNDGQQILQQQNADDDFAGVAVVEHRSGQQFQADDGARKGGGNADQQAVRLGKPERCGNPVAKECKHQCACERHTNRFAHQLQ